MKAAKLVIFRENAESERKWNYKKPQNVSFNSTTYSFKQFFERASVVGVQKKQENDEEK